MAMVGINQPLWSPSKLLLEPVDQLLGGLMAEGTSLLVGHHNQRRQLANSLSLMTQQLFLGLVQARKNPTSPT